MVSTAPLRRFAMISVEEVDRSLREYGLEPSDGQGVPLRQKGSPVAWYRYPVSKARAVEFCLVRESEREGDLLLYFSFSKFSAFEARKAQNLTSTLRPHFFGLKERTPGKSADPS